MSARAGTAPCGHSGEYVIGTYVKCLQGCDTKKAALSDGIPLPLEGDEDPVTKPLCKHCGSDDLYTSTYPIWGSLVACKTCGKVQPTQVIP